MQTEMAPCSIINCANTTKKVEGVNENISFHRFPKDPLVKNKWIEATGRKNWFPTKHSRICSIHFHEDSFTGSSKFRRIIHTAYPTIDVVIMSNNEKDGNPTNTEEENNNGQSHKRKNKRPLTPREKRLYDLVKHQRLVIKRFREQNRRKAKRIEDLETIINYLEGQIKDQNLLPD